MSHISYEVIMAGGFYRDAIEADAVIYALSSSPAARALQVRMIEEQASVLVKRLKGPAYLTTATQLTHDKNHMVLKIRREWPNEATVARELSLPDWRHQRFDFNVDGVRKYSKPVCAT